jgi:hypothetical protein
METETNKKINFLDITIHKEGNNLPINIFRIPTAKDIIIPKVSCHPPEHKHAAIRKLLKRVIAYNLNTNNKKTEHDTIEHIPMNNGFETSIIKQLNKSTPKVNQNNKKNTWA